MFVWTTAILSVVVAFEYVRLAWIKESEPVSATWILMFIVMALSTVMYMRTPDASLSANIGLIAALVNLTVILVGTTYVAYRDDKLKELVFDEVQLGCMVAAGVLVLFWLVTDHPLLSYGLVQFIAVAAYGATIWKQWGDVPERKPEPYLLWCTVLAANLCAVYPAVVEWDPFAAIYLARAVPTTIVMIYVVWRKRRMLELTKSREEIAAMLRWDTVMWVVGMVNVTAMLPQLFNIWATRETAGLSLEMFGIYLGIQIVFAGEGFFKRSRALMVTMILSALVTTTLILSVLWIRTTIA